MLVDDLERLGGDYQHVYLSPHLDDAALSCGARIATQTRAGERVLVVTICTGAPLPTAPLGPLATTLHEQWKLDPAQIFDTRTTENARAMTKLGCDHANAGLLDAIYRHPLAYVSNERLLGRPLEDDALIGPLAETIATLRTNLANVTFYAPLGVGEHVDHVLVHEAARELLPAGVLRFYEDLPYAIQAGASARRLKSVDSCLHEEVAHVDEATLRVKLDAIDAYASQLAMLFKHARIMPLAMSAYAQSVRADGSPYGERVWRLSSAFV